MARAAHPFRTGFVLLLATGLAACGGDDGEGGAESPPPAAIATPDQVRAHLTFVLSQVVQLASEPEAQPQYVPAPFTCSAGGSLEVTPGTRASPYAPTPLATERVRYRDCVRNDGPPANPGSAFTRQHGIEESGSTELADGSTVLFTGAGADATSPLQRQVRAEMSGGVYQEDHFRHARTDYRARQLLFGLSRELEMSSHVEHELSIRYPDGARFVGSFRYGRSDAPFSIISRNNSIRVAGEYQIETARCSTGSMQVQTTRELAWDARNGRFTAGRLEFTFGGGTAVAVFQRNGRVRLTGAGGEELTEPWQPGRLPWESECFSAEGP